jgi:aldehyde dehydrogenase
MDSNLVESIVKDVLAQLQLGGKSASLASSNPTSSGPTILPGGTRRPGVYPCGKSAAAAAAEAFKKLRPLGFDARRKVIKIVKDMCAANAESWGKIELDETRIGRLEHKIAKLQGIPNIPGTEWLRPDGISGDRGITLEEHSPFGVIAAIAPVTHSIPTIACNVINMVAAGNTVVVNAHPGGAKCAAMAVAAFNEAIEKSIGIRDVITIVETPTIESFNELCASEHVSLICVTGGPAVVRAAMKSGKRAICAGPGNPPVVVDSSANFKQAAEDIIFGAAFDNNLLCIGEKQIFVVKEAFDQFIRAFDAAGARLLHQTALQRLTEAAFTYKEDGGGCSHPVLNRDLVGADATKLAEIAGIKVPGNTPLLYAITDLDHPFVQEEQMMPCVPIVKAANIEEAIEMARVSEHGYKHSAMIHTMNVSQMTAMGRALDSTIFIKNGACTAGLGIGGEGYASFSIATTTGEGITTPLTFTRRRRCVLVDNLNIG